MALTLTNDFERVKRHYLDVIAHTPDMDRHARWVYGKHPTDAMLRGYIDRGELYVWEEDGAVAGTVALGLCQRDAEYEAIPWAKALKSDEVAVMHLLAVSPKFQGKGVASEILNAALDLAAKNGKKAFRLDALASNVPAQRLYERAGFVLRGVQNLYAENTGYTDFRFYEKTLDR